MTARNTKTIVTTIKQSDEQKDLIAAMKGMGVSDARIKIFRYVNYPSRPEYIDDVELEVVTAGSLEQFLKEKYGGGSYLCRGFANGEWVKEGTRVIHIAGDKNGDAPAAAKNGDSSDMWKFMMTQQQASSDRMMALMQNSNQTMMQMFTAIVSGTKPLDLGGIAALMGTLKPAGTMTETLDMVTRVVDLTAKFGGGGGGDKEEPDPMMMMLGAGLDLIKGRALPPAGGAAPPPQQAAPGAAAAAAQNPQQQQPNAGWSEQQVFEERLRFLTLLKKKAALGKDPAEWADYIEDNQDDPVCVWLLQMVRQHPWETIAGALKQTDPELAVEPSLSWFSRLYDLLTGEDAGGGNPDAIRKVDTAS